LLLLFGFALHFHHRFHGPPIDYAGLGLAAFASFVGVPGPGEPVLIAAGIFAARHQLDLATVLATAFLGASAGGVVGWLLGMRFGRTLLTARGPLLQMRRAALSRGDEVFERFTVLAIVVTPSWVAGIHHVRSGVYLITNVVSAIVWAVGIGLGAYFAGPAIVEFVGDLGTATAIGLGVLAALAVGLELQRRRRRGRRRYGATATDPATTSAGTAPPETRR
jgi:membrane protein DedA with SNARE-associated domain